MNEPLTDKLAALCEFPEKQELAFLRAVTDAVMRFAYPRLKRGERLEFNHVRVHTGFGYYEIDLSGLREA